MQKEIPTVSVFHFLKNTGSILKNPLPFHHANFEKHGDTFRLKLGLGKSVIFSRDAGLAQYALQKNQKNFKKSPIQTNDLAKYVGKGLLTAEGEHWQKQRKLIQPAFHKKQLAALLDAVYDAIKIELNKIPEGQFTDIFPIFNDLAFQTVVKALFSSAVGEKEIKRLQYITESAQKMMVKELRQPYKKWWFYLSGKIKTHIDLTKEARAILQTIVDARRATGNTQNDLLDMLLEARYDDGGAMPDEQLIDEILILFTAGHETTSNALTFTCKLLANHPKIQEQVAAEVIAAKKESSSLVEFIKNCKYTQCVIEESMRLYPPAYFIDRINVERDNYNGLNIPKGSNLLFSLYEIHKHTDHWEKPFQFNPDRFEDKNLKSQSAYYPFGAGPRKCIGNNFAMYEMILTISHIMSAYHIKALDDSIQIKPLITLKPKEAILKFIPR